MHPEPICKSGFKNRRCGLLSVFAARVKDGKYQQTKCKIGILTRQDKCISGLIKYFVGSQMLTPTSFQGEWESNEASEDVFKDLLRVKKLSQRVSSVESKSKSPP